MINLPCPTTIWISVIILQFIGHWNVCSATQYTLSSLSAPQRTPEGTLRGSDLFTSFESPKLHCSTQSISKYSSKYCMTMLCTWQCDCESKTRHEVVDIPSKSRVISKCLRVFRLSLDTAFSEGILLLLSFRSNRSGIRGPGESRVLEQIFQELLHILFVVCNSEQIGYVHA